MNNRINNAINLIGTEIISTLQDISKPIINNIDGESNQLRKTSKITYYYNESSDYIYVCVELPGVRKTDCNIEISGGNLIIKTNTNYQESNNDYIEINDFKFIENKTIHTKIELNSNNIDEDNINACFINGLLKIKLKKKPKTNININ
jgi:HSP20 family molecular chaperone IbpA